MGPKRGTTSGRGLGCTGVAAKGAPWLTPGRYFATASPTAPGIRLTTTSLTARRALLPELAALATSAAAPRL